MRVCVIGGTRFSGRAFTGAALVAGHDVTVFHRGEGAEDPFPEATHLHGDRDGGLGALPSGGFDAIVDFCAYNPRHVRDGATAVGDGRYVFISSMSAHSDDAPTGATEDDAVYGPPFPDTEEITWETYGPLKVACRAHGDRAAWRPRSRRPAALHRWTARSDRPVHVVGAARRLRRTFPRAGAGRPAPAVRRRTRSRRVRAAPVRAGNGGHLQRGHPAAAADARRRADRRPPPRRPPSSTSCGSIRRSCNGINSSRARPAATRSRWRRPRSPARTCSTPRAPWVPGSRSARSRRRSPTRSRGTSGAGSRRSYAGLDPEREAVLLGDARRRLTRGFGPGYTPSPGAGLRWRFRAVSHRSEADAAHHSPAGPRRRRARAHDRTTGRHTARRRVRARTRSSPGSSSIFSRAPGRASAEAADLGIGEPGDQAAVQVGRAELPARPSATTGVVRAFHNICRHRGHELLPVGERRNQRGDPLPVPRLGLRPRRRPACDAAVQHGLARQERTTRSSARGSSSWHGWLFLNASGDAPLARVATSATSRSWSTATGRRICGSARDHAYELAANWKIAIENYAECYHCSEIHPELCKVTPPDSDIAYPERSTGVWLGGPMELLDHAVTMSLTGESGGVTIPGLPEEKRRAGRLLDRLPEPADQPAPRLRDDAPARAARARPHLGRVRLVLPAGGVRRSRASRRTTRAEFWDVTNREDWAACESVQRNVTLARIPAGPVLVLGGRRVPVAGDDRARPTWRASSPRPSTVSSTASAAGTRRVLSHRRYHPAPMRHARLLPLLCVVALLAGCTAAASTTATTATTSVPSSSSAPTAERRADDGHDRRGARRDRARPPGDLRVRAGRHDLLRRASDGRDPPHRSGHRQGHPCIHRAGRDRRCDERARAGRPDRPARLPARRRGCTRTPRGRLAARRGIRSCGSKRPGASRTRCSSCST